MCFPCALRNRTETQHGHTSKPPSNPSSPKAISQPTTRPPTSSSPGHWPSSARVIPLYTESITPPCATSFTMPPCWSCITRIPFLQANTDLKRLSTGIQPSPLSPPPNSHCSPTLLSVPDRREGVSTLLAVIWSWRRRSRERWGFKLDGGGYCISRDGWGGCCGRRCGRVGQGLWMRMSWRIWGIGWGDVRGRRGVWSVEKWLHHSAL